MIMTTEHLQHVSNSNVPPFFKYDPLGTFSAKPSIRLAVVQPGNRQDDICIKLVHKAFADRPIYDALSYTWGNSDRMETVKINSIPVEVTENLWNALKNLRDMAEERTMWIDALCINQKDLEERSEQVQHMAYIYFRARRVIVWLGVTAPHQAVDESSHGSTGPIKDSLEQTLGSLQPTQVYEPFSSGEILALSHNDYWRRVWIVQEVASAIKIEVHWEAYLSKKESISVSLQWEQFFEQLLLQQIDSDNPARIIANQRHNRHGDKFLLSKLMIDCQESRCTELRDKVYGFVGIAHDCQDGKFVVDYSKSLFELYEDVVRFHQRSIDGSDTVVYFSQVVQKLLGGPTAMQLDLEQTSRARRTTSDVIQVPAKHYGTITFEGPSYQDFIALPEATRAWKLALTNGDARTKPQLKKKSKKVAKTAWGQSTENDKLTLEKLRKKNELFMRTVHELDPSYLARMSTSQRRTFWDGNLAATADNIVLDPNFQAKVKPPIFEQPGWGDFGQPVTPMEAEEPPISVPERDEPCLFSTDEDVIGLIPPRARVGDVLFQFGSSDIVAVVRPSTPLRNAHLIGKALIAPELDSVDRYKESLVSPTMISMDLRLLQLLTE